MPTCKGQARVTVPKLTKNVRPHCPPKKVLAGEFPELAEKITIHLPDESSRRVGQSIAAASLPMIH